MPPSLSILLGVCNCVKDRDEWLKDKITENYYIVVNGSLPEYKINRMGHKIIFNMGAR